MIAIEIENVKEFMSKLFGGNFFDDFHVQSCEIVTFMRIELDGVRQMEWYDTDERQQPLTDNVLWRECRPVVFQLIRGTKAPVKMKLDFSCPRENGDIGSLRLEYSQDMLMAYTGYMQKSFSMDKLGQQDWDEHCRTLLKDY